MPLGVSVGEEVGVASARAGVGEVARESVGAAVPLPLGLGRQERVVLREALPPPGL